MDKARIERYRERKARMFILFITFGVSVLILSVSRTSSNSLIQALCTGPLITFGGITLFFYPKLLESGLFLLTLRGLQAACLILNIFDQANFHSSEVAMLFALMLAYKQHYSIQLARIAVAIGAGIANPKKDHITFIVLILLNFDAVLELFIYAAGLYKKHRQRYLNWRQAKSKPAPPELSNPKPFIKLPKGGSGAERTYPRSSLTNKKLSSPCEHTHQQASTGNLAVDLLSHRLDRDPIDEVRRSTAGSLRLIGEVRSAAREKLAIPGIGGGKEGRIVDKCIHPLPTENEELLGVTDEVIAQIPPESCVIVEERSHQKTIIQDTSPHRSCAGSRATSQNYYTMVDFRSDMRTRVNNFVRQMSTNHRSSGVAGQDTEMASSQMKPFPALSKNIESEYLSMVDQIIIVSDQNLSVIYNNYHERFVGKIIKPLRHMIDQQKIRKRFGFKLNKVFKSENGHMQVDESTLTLLGLMLDELDVELSSHMLGTYFKSSKTIHVAVSLLSILKRNKKKLESSCHSRCHSNGMYIENRCINLTLANKMVVSDLNARNVHFLRTSS